MKKQKFTFIKPMAKLTKGAIVIDPNGNKYHTIIKVSLDAVKDWNNTHKSHLFISSNHNGFYYDCDAFNYGDSFTTSQLQGDYFVRRTDAGLLKKIAKKYNLETYIIRYRIVDTEAVSMNRCKKFDITWYYTNHKYDLWSKAEQMRRAKKFAATKSNELNQLNNLSNAIIKAFADNIDNNDFYFNCVLDDIKKQFINAKRYYHEMESGEISADIDQLKNYIKLISEKLNLICKHNQTRNTKSNEEAIAEALYYDSRNNCNWEAAEFTDVLSVLSVKGEQEL